MVSKEAASFGHSLGLCWNVARKGLQERCDLHSIVSPRTVIMLRVLVKSMLAAVWVSSPNVQLLWLSLVAKHKPRSGLVLLHSLLSGD